MNKLIFLILLFSTSTQAQSFFKKYTVDTSRWERKQNIHFLDENIYSTTAYASGPVLNGIVELIIDEFDTQTGETIGRHKIQNEYSFEAHKSIVSNELIIGIGWQSNEGGFLTKNIGVYKLNTFGDIIYFKSIGDPDRRDIPADLYSDLEENTIIGSRREFQSGAGYTYKSVVTKVDSNGSFLWEYIDDIPTASVEMRSVVTDDANFIYALSNQDGSQDSVRLTKLSSDGDKIWTRTYQEGFHSKSQQIVNLANGNLLIAGYAFYDKYNGGTSNFYMEIDTAGSPIWIKDYRPDIGGVAYESDIIILEDGKIARVYDGFGYPTLMVTSPNGEIDFIKYYFDLDVRFPDDLLQLEDGSFVMVGWINPSQDPDNYTSWMMRTDIEGNLVTTISETANDNVVLNIYPNPTSTMLNIEIDDMKIFNKIKVYDITGQLVLETLSTNQIDVSLLKNGIYVLNLEQKKGGVISKMFVKK